MVRWLLFALASALCADAGRPERGYADYSAARMPQYDTLYDAHAASVPADDYRDRSDGSASVDYNTYEQDPSEKRNAKVLQDDDIYQIPASKHLGKEPTTGATDDSDADYNLKTREIIPKNKNGNKRPRIKIEAEEADRMPKLNRNSKKFQKRSQDDDVIDDSPEYNKADKESDSFNEKGKFVRREIRPKVQRNSYLSKSALSSDPEYDERSDSRKGKGANKVDGPLYSDPEMERSKPNVEPDEVSSAERGRQPGRKTGSDYNEDSDNASSQRHKAPMPKTRQKNIEYVDYNDMNRIEKIKNLPTESTKVPVSSPAAQTSVAERELQALLGRKEVPPGPALPPSMRPDSVSPHHEAQWAQFTVDNHSPRPRLSKDRSSPSLTDTPLKTYIGRHDDDYPLINGNDFLSHGASFNKKYGKSVNNKDTLEDKKDDNELWEAQAAFLGPNLWDKTLPYDPDLKYVDLDEFLSENGMQGEALGGAHLGGSAFGAGAGLALGLQAPVTKRERSPSPSDCMSPDTINPPLSPADSTFSMASSGRDFDPRTRAFSDEELKPQPMIKKSRKQFVPDDLKDDKYWARRRKNNMAAKRSRDARRMKENQIALRAGYLEKENMGLRQEVELLKKENHILREKLSKYADV